MAVTVTGEGTATNVTRHSLGDARLHIGTINFDDSYPTGGESLTPTQVGLHKIQSIDFSPYAGYVFQYNYTTEKIMVYQAPSAAVAGTISKPTFTVEASGAIGANMEIGLSADATTATVEGGSGISAQRVLTTTSPVGTPTFTGTATTAGVLTEVPAATDLSLILVRFRAIGY